MIRLLMMLTILSIALAACGTKGSLECPKGTQERIDGTCRPPGD
jgi:predicted small lipoprotein YifL